jgi:hypothetical protein
MDTPDEIEREPHAPRPRLTRKKAARYVEETHGAPCSESKLSKLAVYGGGPPFVQWGRDTLYEPDDLDAWVSARLDRAVKATSTSAHAIPGRVKPKGRPPKDAARMVPPHAARQQAP